MTSDLPRRRFLTITAAFAALPAMAHASAPVAEWRGAALGAGASLRLVGVDRREARGDFAAVEAELSRLEDIFSLYRAGSALSVLNRDGRLPAPPPEMLELLSLAGAIHASTNGAFDPTIQPLWALYAETPGHAPDRAMLTAARARTGWSDVRIEPTEIAFAHPRMAMTLNGIAQGYITDRVAALLRGRGFSDVLVDMGEIAGLGRRADGGAWQVGVAAPDGRVIRRTTLKDRALATSSPMGTRIGDDGDVGHILDPRHGAPHALRDIVSVSADRAALADALSTAFCIMDDKDVSAALLSHPAARLEALGPRVSVA
ncbi:FAD:protein FMN transferase [Pikeienuella sp. HZG-20]|uniref:FAD:protein FMN transferase n=1 Tax=Paludibacillus litoralis TaxID=3133267 RepID=UPI0030ECDE39